MIPGARRVLGFLVAIAAGSPGAAVADGPLWTERPGWARHFEAAGVTGTIAIYDGRDRSYLVHDRDRAGTGFIPASTFKIPHALFALDAGIVRDEFQVFPWDSVKREIPGWNRDQDLRSSMRHSVVWVYQEIARALGERRERELLERIRYGNANPSGGIDRFWLDGALRISAFQQMEFLRALHRNELPFDVAHQRLVKDVILIEAGPDWILRAKTGWGARMDPQIGWWVGWVERPDGAVFFALNIDMPNQGDDAPKRISIAKTILREIGALPPAGSR